MENIESVKCKHFVVMDRDGTPMMSTDYYSCIPPENHLQTMSAAGYSFKYDNKKISLKTAIELTNYLDNLESSLPKVFKIRCIETGELFDKQSEAAKHLSIDPAAVSDSLKTGKKRSGYTFDRIEVIR